MGRLIEEKSVIEIAEKCTFTDESERRKYLDFVRYCVKQSKTAYNPEKVVAELEEQKWNVRDWRDTMRNNIISECIDIVKAGGINE